MLMIKKTKIISAFTVAAVLSPAHAWAYLDPGTGGILLQGLLAALAAGIVAVKTYWSRIKGLFKRKDRDG